MRLDNVNAQQLCATVTEDDRLVIRVEPVELAEPGPNEVVVEMQAVPINPSDLGVLFGAANTETLRRETVDGMQALVASLRPGQGGATSRRRGTTVHPGNEGAGRVVAAGGEAQSLLGRVVTMAGGRMYRTHRVIDARHVVALPEGASASEGASLFINPMTVLGFLNTMRAEGHEALVHTAAASNLGQMLAKVCVEEGVPLVGVVRSDAQAAILRELGVAHVVDTSKQDFMDQLIDALTDTGARLGFDAIGGGRMASDLLFAMERAQMKRGVKPTTYGTPVDKQVYVYGRLDASPIELSQNWGLYWGVGGWLLTPHLAQVGPERVREMRERVIERRNDLFVSRYTRTISLEEMIDPDVARAYDRKATGEKYLVDPSR